MTNAPIGEQIDDPLNDGVELVEDLQGQAGLPTGDRMDVAKIRIEKLNQERQERVARRRDPQSCLKRGCIASYPTAASSPPDATLPAHRWAPEYLRCRT
ncbi:amino acid permease, partial [Trypanosoma cruzi]